MNESKNNTYINDIQTPNNYQSFHTLSVSPKKTIANDKNNNNKMKIVPTKTHSNMSTGTVLYHNTQSQQSNSNSIVNPLIQPKQQLNQQNDCGKY